MVASLGFKWNFVIEAALYVIIVLLLIPVRLPYRTEGSRQHSSALSSLISGLRHVKNDRRILQLIIMSLIPNLLFQPVIFFLPVFTVDVLGREIGAGGALAAAVGIGGIVAAVFIAGIGYLMRKGLAVFLGLIGGCAFILFFAQSQWLWVSFAMMAGLGFSQYVFRVANGTLIQTVVPDAFRSRVMSIYMLDHGMTPLATMLIGLAIDLWSPTWTFTILAAVALFLAIVQTTSFHSTRQLE